MLYSPSSTSMSPNTCASGKSGYMFCIIAGTIAFVPLPHLAADSFPHALSLTKALIFWEHALTTVYATHQSENYNYASSDLQLTPLKLCEHLIRKG